MIYTPLHKLSYFPELYSSSCIVTYFIDGPSEL